MDGKQLKGSEGAGSQLWVGFALPLALPPARDCLLAVLIWPSMPTRETYDTSYEEWKQS